MRHNLAISSHASIRTTSTPRRVCPGFAGTSTRATPIHQKLLLPPRDMAHITRSTAGAGLDLTTEPCDRPESQSHGCFVRRPVRPNHARSAAGIADGCRHGVRGVQLRVAAPAHAGPRRPQVLAQRRRRRLRCARGRRLLGSVGCAVGSSPRIPCDAKNLLESYIVTLFSMSLHSTVVGMRRLYRRQV